MSEVLLLWSRKASTSVKSPRILQLELVCIFFVSHNPKELSLRSGVLSLTALPPLPKPRTLVWKLLVPSDESSLVSLLAIYCLPLTSWLHRWTFRVPGSQAAQEPGLPWTQLHSSSQNPGPQGPVCSSVEHPHWKSAPRSIYKWDVCKHWAQWQV